MDAKIQARSGRWWGSVVLALALTVGGSGCALLRRAAGSAMAPVAAGLQAGLQKQSDLQLVREGSPAFLLMTDGLIEAFPDNPDLLLAGANAQIAYASAFVGREEQERAAAFNARALEYALRVLDRRRPGFAALRQGTLAELEKAVPAFGRRDVPALYIAARAWIGWILASPNSVEALSQLSSAMALMKRVQELDPAYDRGGPDLFYGIYYAVLPGGAGRDLEKSKRHFEAAFQAGGSSFLLPRVMFAEFYARYAFDRELFETTLRSVLEPLADPPELRLLNAVSRARARRLLDQTDEYF